MIHALHDAEITLLLCKCKFFTDFVKNLGHVIHDGRLETEQNPVQYLIEDKDPLTRTKPRFLLGIGEVFLRFNLKFSDIAEPLNAIFRKG